MKINGVINIRKVFKIALKNCCDNFVRSMIKMDVLMRSNKFPQCQNLHFFVKNHDWYLGGSGGEHKKWHFERLLFQHKVSTLKMKIIIIWVIFQATAVSILKWPFFLPVQEYIPTKNYVCCEILLNNVLLYFSFLSRNK